MRRCQPRPNPQTLAVCFLGLLSIAAPLSADIYEWEYIDPLQPELGKQESTTLVPDGYGAQIGPNSQLQNRNLSKAYLVDGYLRDANITDSILTNSYLFNTDFFRADLSGTDFTGSDLTEARFNSSNLNQTDFTGTIINGASFYYANNFQFSQLASTQSYQDYNLQGIDFRYLQMSNWDLSGQDLAGARFSGANLSGVILANANIHNADFSESDLSDAITFSQLISTQSYQDGELYNINFNNLDIGGWDFSYRDLSGSTFKQTNLAGVGFAGAVINDVAFNNFNAVEAITFGQIASTASYQNDDLRGVMFVDNELPHWDLSGKDLSGAVFTRVKMDGTILTNTNLKSASFAYDLVGRRCVFYGAEMSGANLSDAKLFGVTMYNVDLKRANMTGALRGNPRWIGVDLRGATNLSDYLPDGYDIYRCIFHPDGTVPYGFSAESDDVIWIRDDDGGPTLTPIPITVQTAFDIDPDAKLRLLFEDADWGSTILFDPSVGTAYFGGTLELAMKLDEGLSPVDLLGATFQLFDWTGVTLDGWFDDVVIDPAWFAAGFGFDLSQLQTSGVVRVVPLIGDLDGDGFVGIADLNIILANWNQAVTPGSLLSGDLSGDGFVGIDDLNTVLGTWNDSVPPPGIGSSVPEPAGAVLLGIGVAVTAGRRRII